MRRLDFFPFLDLSSDIGLYNTNSALRFSLNAEYTGRKNHLFPGDNQHFKIGGGQFIAS